MLAAWGAIKKSFSCEGNASEVYDPELSRKSSRIRKCRSRYSCESISDLKGVVDGSKRRRIKLKSQSPLSIRSNESIRMFHRNNNPDLFSRNPSGSSITHSQLFCSLGSRVTTCEKCGANLKRQEDAEAHHLSKHAVTELVEGDPSRNIIERILQTGQSSPKSWLRNARILKAHNLQITLAQFEEYREMVKIRAHNLSKKHPRCLADGNELLRFHGTTFTCSLGDNGSTTLCRSGRCNLCCILRHGFKSMKSSGDLFTASTAEEAYKSMQLDEVNRRMSTALILCRVIAGRVQKPVDHSLDKAAQLGFDSVAGKLGHNGSIEKLYSLDPNALLPCFVMVCKF